MHMSKKDAYLNGVAAGIITGALERQEYDGTVDWMMRALLKMGHLAWDAALNEDMS